MVQVAERDGDKLERLARENEELRELLREVLLELPDVASAARRLERRVNERLGEIAVTSV